MSDETPSAPVPYAVPGMQDASAQDWLGSNQDPDVLLSIPNLGVDSITLKVNELHARVDLHARILDLMELHVGADVHVESVELDIQNVRAQAMLKVRLDEVAHIVDRVMTTIDNNPEILTSLLHGGSRTPSMAPAAVQHELEPPPVAPVESNTSVTSDATSDASLAYSTGPAPGDTKEQDANG